MGHRAGIAQRATNGVRARELFQRVRLYGRHRERVLHSGRRIFRHRKAVLDEAVKFFGDKKPAEVIAYSMKETLWTKNHDTPDVVSYQPNAFLYEWMA